MDPAVPIRRRAGARPVLALFVLALGVLVPALAPTRASAAVEWPAADWKHTKVVITYLRQHPAATRPVVHLLGGSVARESTIGDRSWRRQIVDLGGPRVLAFNLGATNQTYRDNIEMVELLPSRPGLVLIGVNVGRYTKGSHLRFHYSPVSGHLTLAQVDAYPQHRFGTGNIMTDSEKRALVSEWLRIRYPAFKEHFAYQAARLRELVELCQARGLKVVMFNLPINRQIVGHRLDAPRERYKRDCLNVSATYGVPYVDFVSDVRLSSRDFIDNWHLAPSGRVRWQRRLARMTVYWLEKYGIPEPPPYATAAPTSSSTDAATPAPDPAPSPAGSSPPS